MPPAYSDKLRTAFLRVLHCVYDQFLYFIYIKKQTNKTKITKKIQLHACTILHTKVLKPQTGYWFCNILAVKLRLVEELERRSRSTNTLKDLK